MKILHCVTPCNDVWFLTKIDSFYAIRVKFFFGFFSFNYFSELFKMTSDFGLDNKDLVEK